MVKLDQNQLLVLTASFIGFVTYRKLNPPYIKLLAKLLILIFLGEYLGQFLALKGINNAIVYNFLSLIIFTYFIYFFKSTIQKNSLKKIIGYIQIFLPTICIINIFLFQGINTFHTYTYSISCLIMVGLGIIFFFDFFNRPSNSKVLLDPTILISTAVIFYYISNVSIIGVVNTLSKMPIKTIETIQVFLLIINIFFYSILTSSFICHTYLVKSSSRQ